MESDDRTDIYEETISRSTSQPVEEVKGRRVRTTQSGKTEEYEGRSERHTEEEDSVSAKARDAGESLKALVNSIGLKTKQITEDKARELKAQSLDIGMTTDARDIQFLGENVEKLVSVFEDTMSEIRKEPYDEQAKLLLAYKKLLEEQINVINARMEMAKRLKPGA